jgi:glycosyltransferase involved in cell wall biosynthesis
VSDEGPNLHTYADCLPVRIICLNRLVYRKGIDLLIGALPRICAMHKDIDFLIGQYKASVLPLLSSILIFDSTGGDGPMIIELEQLREKHQDLLGDRVQLLGTIGSEKVRDVRHVLSVQSTRVDDNDHLSAVSSTGTYLPECIPNGGLWDRHSGGSLLRSVHSQH